MNEQQLIDKFPDIVAPRPPGPADNPIDSSIQEVEATMRLSELVILHGCLIQSARRPCGSWRKRQCATCTSDSPNTSTKQPTRMCSCTTRAHTTSTSTAATSSASPTCLPSPGQKVA